MISFKDCRAGDTPLGSQAKSRQKTLENTIGKGQQAGNGRWCQHLK